MIYLNTGDNEVVLNLYARSNNVLNPYFIFKITNRDTFLETIFTADDYSISPYDFNSFTMSVGTVFGPTAGQILDIPGQYDLDVYETNTQYDLIISTVSNLVKNAILNIGNTYSQPASFTQSLTYDVAVFRGSGY